MSGDEIRTNRLAALLRKPTFRDQATSFLQGASNAAASNISGPVDGLAWILRKAGVPVGDAPVGSSQWMSNAGFTVNPKNELAGYLGEGAGLSAPIAAFSKAPQIAGGLLSLDEHAMNMLRRGAEKRMADSGMMQSAAPFKPWTGAPRAATMTPEQAQKIVANEDYLPWDQVKEAKRVLGIKEESAADIWAQMLAAKKAPPGAK